MQTTLILYLILALLFGLAIAYFQYYFKVKNKLKITGTLFVLKGLSIFLLILLLINPKIEETNITNIKPVLTFLVDNSNSVSFFKEDKNVEVFIKELEKNSQIQQKFDVQKFSFANDLQVLDSLSFTENQTNISNAILNVNELQNDKISPIVLITDGNQTIGQDYEFINVKQPIYPIVIGDTTKYVDVKISQLNVNKYSYIKNKFPVEVILNYEGNENVTTQFSIFNKGKTVFRKNVRFSASKKSLTVIANLTSIKEGLQYYTASISKIENEKNTKNNSKSFSVEVIDEQTKVLLLTSVLHPDLGAFKKAIESNKQRSVEIYHIDNFKNNIKDYQLVILFQLNNKFNKVIDQIKENNNNYLLVSGASSDWNFINQKELGVRKNSINETENYGAVFNDGFLNFLQEDIGFNNYPPLKDKFGEVSFTKEHQTLLYQNINGLETQQPLLATFDINNQKSGILLGEGIWRWRANSFLNTNSFEDFDKFIGNIVQFLASNKKRNRLEVDAESLYPANSTITISAFYTDKNYQFDPRASLEITVTNTTTKVVTKVPFSLVNNAFKTEIENLNSGDYTYKVTVLGQSISKNGRFKITDYNIEEQFTNANIQKLQKLADKTGGNLFYKNQAAKITKKLLANESFYTVQKATKKQVNLIDWQWILFLVIALLTAEWFLRKYFGKI
ncbi:MULTISPECIES: VWA domain-containing protein [Polaribacter]|uniref:VWA domain-containing protein n=1 Tax=Polaribacter TaxID=52959 RepID=UPI002090E01E|nr:MULTISPECIES: VWA domain-containing protein [Polaribacter]MDO6741518.1 VWA domain-containing protein [Polaribacter sp. 1_MG-2023]